MTYNVFGGIKHSGVATGGGGPPRVTPSRGWHPKEKFCGQIDKE